MFETVNEKDEKALLCALMYNEQHHGVLPIIGNPSPAPCPPSVIVFTECNISFGPTVITFSQKLSHLKY